jgi:hypothetical protein
MKVVSMPPAPGANAVSRSSRRNRRQSDVDRRRSTAPADVIGKALGVVRIVRQKVEPLALHPAAVATVEPAHLQFQENPRVAARQIAHPANLMIVPALLTATATTTNGFFDRRLGLGAQATDRPVAARAGGCCPGRRRYASGTMNGER